ncbi:MAG: phage Gp37/Gp68 family protein [Desulfovibrio sp.]|jgi:protein gp37|nr:phage Gp37/Gp68 family protein [Desulfovibrio sp.]
MSATRIEWCDLTINPIVGCSKCSEGCQNCYAERFAARLAKHPNPKISSKYAGVVDKHGKWTGEVSGLDLYVFDGLPHKPKRIFVGSMTDIFHENVSYDTIDDIFTECELLESHTFYFLTKRPQNIRPFLDWCEEHTGRVRFCENTWLGVTVCNQQEADDKIPVLLQAPAVKRFVSVEPCLGPVDIGKYLYDCYECSSCGKRMPHTEVLEEECFRCGFTAAPSYETWGDGNVAVCPECGASSDIDPVCPDCGAYVAQHHPDTPCIDWCIVGGETGPGARPLHPDWVRSLRDQCQEAGVPFFLKSWGEWSPRTDDSPPAHAGTRVGKHRAGRLLDGRTWEDVPS